MKRWFLLGLLVGGCDTDVVLEGRVLAYRAATTGAAGATVELRDDAFEPVVSTVAAADGAFSLIAPRGQRVHLVIDGDGLVPIAFPGESGRIDSVVPYGQLWAFRPSDEAAWRTMFAGCPGAEDGAGMIVGTAYPDLPVDDVTAAGDPWPMAQATLTAFEDGATPIEACYLADVATPETPSTYDPDAWVTGKTGRFAFFGVEGGPWELTLLRCVAWTDTACTQTLLARSTVFVPEGGVVERTPALVPF